MSKVTAKDLNDQLLLMPLGVISEQSRSILDKCDKHLKHSIGMVNIYKFNSEKVLMINKKSLYMRWFDTLDIAIDFCLDKYKSIAMCKQGELFNE